MQGLRERKKKQTKEAILQAAIQLFGEKGFEKTSIEELAQRAGIGKGTVYSYFRTKSDILHSFCEYELEILHQELTARADQDISILEQMVTIYMGEFKHFAGNEEFARLFLRHTVFPRPETLERQRVHEDKYFAMLFPLLEKAQQKGELRTDIDLLYITGHFHGLYLVAVSAWFSGKVTSDGMALALETLFRQALEGLQPCLNTSV